jgi:hypothetical protein
MITLKMDNYRIVDGFELYVRCAGITHFVNYHNNTKGKTKTNVK